MTQVQIEKNDRDGIYLAKFLELFKLTMQIFVDDAKDGKHKLLKLCAMDIREKEALGFCFLGREHKEFILNYDEELKRDYYIQLGQNSIKYVVNRKEKNI